MPEVITSEEFEQRMREIDNMTDQEDRHVCADDLMCTVLEQLGYGAALQSKIEESYKVLQLAAEMSKLYYQAPLIITYSGGKDSDTVLQLAIECLKRKKAYLHKV